MLNFSRILDPGDLELLLLGDPQQQSARTLRIGKR
jgi:hypothetical protein